MWNLQAAGRLYNVLGIVREKGTAALASIQLAGNAIAEGNFSASNEQFAASQTLLREARLELDEALATSDSLVRALDITGAVRTSDNLLGGIEQLAGAGQNISNAISLLLSSSSTSLIDALLASQKEFKLADSKLAQASQSLDETTLLALPTALRAKVQSLQAAIPRIREPVQIFSNQSDLLLKILGAERQRQYLLLFQNNHELRPTGGFIGSLALINLDKGVLENIDVQTVYDPDGQLKEYIAPPEQLRLITDRWFLRDANWFIDWEVSAQKIAAFFEKEGGPTVDGVIALTPEVMKDLLAITGPIHVPIHNVTVDQDNFVSVTQDLVTYSYDRAQNKPKQFLVDLAPILLNKLFSAGSEQTLDILDAIARNMHEKQLLAFFTDQSEQAELAGTGLNASLPEQHPGFLQVNNANIGGHKSDQFIAQEIDYRTEVNRSGDAEVVLTIRRTHHGPSEVLQLPYPAGENPAYKDNVVWQRVLVPTGSVLLDARGFSTTAEIPRPIGRAAPLSNREILSATADLKLEVDADVAEWQRGQQIDPSGTVIGHEAGYDFFGNWMITKPGDTMVGVYRYRLPQKVAALRWFNRSGSFVAYISKQPGDSRTDLRVEIQLPSEQRIVHNVPQDGVTRLSDASLVYRGQLQTDVIVGAVFE